MAPKRYWLTEKDRDELQRVVTEHNRRAPPGAGRGAAPEHEPHQAPEVYACRTPAGGLPALAANTTGTGSEALGDDEPGFADCDVYRLLDDGSASPTMEPVDGLTHRVGNLSSAPISGRQWVLATRDKYGTWWATEVLRGSDDWVVCQKVVERVYCSGNEVYYDAVYFYITSDGRIVDVSDTPCPGEDTGTGSPVSLVTFTLPGVGNGTCSDCANLNATWTMIRQDETHWIPSGTVPTVCGTSATFFMTYDAGAGVWTFEIWFGGSPSVFYTNSTAGALWDGSSTMVLQYASAGPQCMVWPVTITLTPA